MRTYASVLLCYALFGWCEVALGQPAPPVSTLSGIVLSATTKQPLPGAMLFIYRASKTGESPLWQQLLITDQEGRYELAAVPAGTYQVGVIGRGHIPQADLIQVPGGVPVTRHFELESLREVTGRVVRADGKPLQSTELRYDTTLPEMLRSSLMIILRGRRQVFVDPMAGWVPLGKDGSFRLPNMVPGAVTLMLDAPQDGCAFVNVTFPPQGNADAGTVELRPPVRIKGTVINAHTNQPVPSAYVYLRCRDMPASYWDGGYYYGYTKTDSQGRFAFDTVVPHSSYSLYAYARAPQGTLRGYAMQTDFSSPGQEYTLTISISARKPE